MQRAFFILIIVGIIIWAFLALERARLDNQLRELAGQADDANTADRCAQYRMTDEGDESVWSLGYAGRVRQILQGCF